MMGPYLRKIAVTEAAAVSMTSNSSWALCRAYTSVTNFGQGVILLPDSIGIECN